MTPDRPTELRERITKFRLENFGDLNVAPKNPDDAKVAELMKEAIVMRIEQGLFDLIDQEASERSRTDQRELLERLEKVVTENTDACGCLRYIYDEQDILARLEGEGK